MIRYRWDVFTRLSVVLSSLWLSPLLLFSAQILRNGEMRSSYASQEYLIFLLTCFRATMSENILSAAHSTQGCDEIFLS